MYAPSSELKQSLHQSRQKQYETGQNKKITQDLFMQHFESINQKKNQVRNFQTAFASKMHQLSTLPSKIDHILAAQDQSYTPSQLPPLIYQPLCFNLRSNISNRITQINAFFRRQQILVQQSDQDTNLFDLERYSAVLVELTRLNKRQKQKNNNDSPQQYYQQKKTEIPIQTTFPLSFAQSQKKPTPKIRKAEIIMLDIAREKKKSIKNEEYTTVMEIKLTQLLQYILQGEEKYVGMNLANKMKEVIKDLDQFRGKIIDGENKINLLRIFFEEFKNLKQFKSDKNSRTEKLNNFINVKKSNRSSVKNSRKIDQKQEEVKKVSKKVAEVKRNLEDQWIGELQ